MAFSFDDQDLGERFAGDVFDLESFQHDQQDSPAFAATPSTDPFEVARIEKVRDIQPDGSVRIRVNGYDDQMGPRSIPGFMDTYADKAYSITRDAANEEALSMDRIDQSPEFRNPKPPQYGEPGYSGKPLNIKEQDDISPNGLSWSQEVDSDEAAGALIRGIANRDERQRENFLRNAGMSKMGLFLP